MQGAEEGTAGRGEREQEPQLEETPETPPSSRAEGLLFLHGLESNPGSGLHARGEGERVLALESREGTRH